MITSTTFNKMSNHVDYRDINHDSDANIFKPGMDNYDRLNVIIRECSELDVNEEHMCMIFRLYIEICDEIINWLENPDDQTMSDIFDLFNEDIKAQMNAIGGINDEVHLFSIYKLMDQFCFKTTCNADHFSMAFKRPLPGNTIYYHGEKRLVLNAGAVTMCLAEIKTGMEYIIQNHRHSTAQLSKQINQMQMIRDNLYSVYVLFPNEPEILGMKTL